MATLDALKRRQIAAAAAATEKTMRAIVARGQLLAPIEEGTLRGSGDVEPPEITATGVTVTGFFATVYAARQHEELDWEHPRGGQAKYLEEPFKQAIPRYPAIVAAAVRSVT
jgi:hypothetical protein